MFLVLILEHAQVCVWINGIAHDSTSVLDIITRHIDNRGSHIRLPVSLCVIAHYGMFIR